jgi:hypothetical protein
VGLLVLTAAPLEWRALEVAVSVRVLAQTVMETGHVTR